jgi:hypothetical protein
MVVLVVTVLLRPARRSAWQARREAGRDPALQAGGHRWRYRFSVAMGCYATVAIR